jgi:hypothetical protein
MRSRVRVREQDLIGRSDGFVNEMKLIKVPESALKAHLAVKKYISDGLQSNTYRRDLFTVLKPPPVNHPKTI